MITRRTCLHQMLLALGATSCSSPDPAGGDRNRNPAVPNARETNGGARLKLTAAHIPVLCLVGPRIAFERGFFAAEGLDVTLLPGVRPGKHEHFVSRVVGASGPVPADITFMEYPALVDMASGNLEYYVVAGEHSGCLQLIVPANSPVQSLADLKGKRIGLPEVLDPLIWEYLIRQAGVPLETVEWVRTTTRGLEQVAFVGSEFAARQLDAYVAIDPIGEILKSDGVARLLASNTWTPPLSGWYCCMIAVRREVIDTHPEVAGAVTRAYRQAAAFIEQNPAEAVALSVKAGYMPAETRQDLAARLLGEYVWTATGRIDEDLERYFRLLIEAGRLPASSSPAELVKRVYRSGD